MTKFVMRQITDIRLAYSIVMAVHTAAVVRIVLAANTVEWADRTSSVRRIAM